MKHQTLLFSAITILLGSCSSHTNKLTIAVSPVEITTPARGGEYTVEVLTENQWTASVNDGWVRINPTSGEGSAEVTVKISAAKEAIVSSSEVVFTDGENSARLSISREALATSLAVTPAEINAPKNGGTYTLQITSTISWSVSSSVNWMTVSKGVGRNSDNVVVTINAATIPETTNGTLTLSPFGSAKDIEPIIIPVTRQGTDATLLEVSPQTVDAGAEGGSYSLDVNCTAQWVAQTDVDWIKLNTTEGSNNGTLSFTVDAHSSLEADMGVITIMEKTTYSKPAELQVVVNRAAAKPFITLSNESLEIDRKGAVCVVKVNSNVQWTVSASDWWIDMKTTGGTGQGSVMFNVLENTTFSPRTGYVSFTGTYNGTKIEQTLVVTQERTVPTLTISPTEISIVYASIVWGAENSYPGTIEVKSNTKWKVSVKYNSSGKTLNNNWITFTSTTGERNGTIDFKALGDNLSGTAIAVIYVEEVNADIDDPLKVGCTVTMKPQTGAVREH